MTPQQRRLRKLEDMLVSAVDKGEAERERAHNFMRWTWGVVERRNLILELVDAADEAGAYRRGGEGPSTVPDVLNVMRQRGKVNEADRLESSLLKMVAQYEREHPAAAVAPEN